MIHGGTAINGMAESSDLAATTLSVPDKILLIRYEDYAGNRLSNGKTVRAIAAFFHCAVDSATIQRIANKFNVSAVEDFLFHAFEEKNVTSFRAWDQATRLHARHVSPLHGDTDYRELLMPETIQQVLNESEGLLHFAERFWPERTAEDTAVSTGRT